MNRLFTFVILCVLSAPLAQAGGGEMTQKMFQQNLSSEVQKVGRFVQHQQIGVVQQQ